MVQPANPELKSTQRAPTLYAIITIKLAKGLLLLVMAWFAYTLADHDLPEEFRHLLQILRLDPEKKFFSDAAVQIGKITRTNILWVAVGTFVYSLFSWVEGIGLIFRVSWAGWLAIGESAFFIPIEVYDLLKGFSWTVIVILGLNIMIVWYLLQNRRRLFRHHHH
jgi:uncharacterized membrane protein (DUF2068 family)